MKLPHFNNTTRYGHYNNSYAFAAMPGGAPGGRSIHMLADEDKADIYACVRSINGQTCPCHCYLTRIQNGQIVDSRGYFNTGPGQEWDTSGSCRLVKKNASASDWRAATETYDRRTGGEYDLTTNNCCTAAVDGANAVPGGGAPINVYTANAGIGTITNKCVIQ